MKLRQVVREVPLDQLMIETDTPCLAPQKHRGKQNERKKGQKRVRPHSITVCLT